MVTRRVSEGLAGTGLATSPSLTRRVPLSQLVIKAVRQFCRTRPAGRAVPVLPPDRVCASGMLVELLRLGFSNFCKGRAAVTNVRGDGPDIPNMIFRPDIPQFG